MSPALKPVGPAFCGLAAGVSMTSSMPQELDTATGLGDVDETQDSRRVAGCIPALVTS